MNSLIAVSTAEPARTLISAAQTGPNVTHTKRAAAACVAADSACLVDRMRRPCRAAGEGIPICAPAPSASGEGLCLIARLSWHHTRDDLAAVPPIDAEIVIGRQQNRVGENLRHANETGVGKAHRHVRVLVHQLE